MKGQAAPNYRKRKNKKVESNLNLGIHNQTLLMDLIPPSKGTV
jgi:hypothetical protein